MSHAFFNMVTDLGDSAVTGMLALALIVYLLMTKQPRATLALLSSLTLAVGIMLAGKLTLYSRCQLTPLIFDIRSPSGHSALSMVVYGLLAAFVSSSQRGWWRFLPYIVVIPLIVLIGISRLILHYHTTGDVLIGFAVGLFSSFIGWTIFMRGHKVHASWWPFAIMAIIVLGLCYGIRLPAESLINDLSNLIRHYVRGC